MTKFQDKFASLRQVNSPYSWNKFQICCIDMYLIRFLPNFAGFCRFLQIWIPPLRDHMKYQKPCRETLLPLMHFTKLKSPPSLYQASPTQKCLKKIINIELMVDNIQRPRAKFETKNKYFVWMAWTSLAMWSLRLHHRKVVTKPQERIVNGWEVQSLVPIQRGFSLFIIAMASLMQHLIVYFCQL